MKNTMIKIVTACMIGMLATACVSTGGNQKAADKETVKQIEVGKTTKADLVAMIGEPTQADFTDSGAEKWFYQTYDSNYGKGVVASSILGAIIPFGGMLVGGEAKSNSLTILFDDNGVVQKVASGSSDYKHGVFQL